MKVQITTVAELGEVIRATRKANNIRLDDVASMAGLGPVFVGERRVRQGNRPNGPRSSAAA